MSTTFRADLVAGFTTMMAAFISANPSLLTRHFRYRPESLKDLPCSYLDLRPEEVRYYNGVQQRVITPTLIVVGKPTEGGQMADSMDALVDSLVEFIGGYGGSFGGHITATSVWSRMTIADGIEEDGESRFPAARFTFPDLENVEGR